jgi:hypothetical protein
MEGDVRATEVTAKPAISAATNALKVGMAGEPVVGPAKTKFAVCVLRVPVKVPLVVTGLPLTVKMEGNARATEVTVPVPPPVAAIVKLDPLGVMVIPVPAVKVRSPVKVLRLVTPLTELPPPFEGHVKLAI